MSAARPAPGQAAPQGAPSPARRTAAGASPASRSTTGAPTTGASTAGTAAARLARRGSHARRAAGARTPARSTPARLRRLGTMGLLAGTLTGIAALVGPSTAQDAATDAANSGSLAGQTAAVRIEKARVEAAQALLTPSKARNDAAAGAMRDAAADLSGAEDASPRALLQEAGIDFGRRLAAANASGWQSTDTLLAGAASMAGPSGSDGPSAAQARATAGMGGTLLVGGVSTLLLLGGAGWLARRTKRVVNPPLVAGILLVAGSTLWAVSAAGAATTAIDRGDETTTTAASASQIAYEARAVELSGRLPGADTSAPRTRWGDLQGAAEAQFASYDSGALSSAWASYVRSAAPNVEAPEASSATSQEASAAAFAKVAGPLDRQLGTDAPPASVAPGEPGILGWIRLALGIGGGLLASAGFGRRLEEYR